MSDPEITPDEQTEDPEVVAHSADTPGLVASEDGCDKFTCAGNF